MVFLIPIIIGVLLWGCSTTEDADLLFCKQQTASINAIFVILIFIRHFSQYIQVERIDKFLISGQGKLHQLIVVTFLFFSGYSFIKQFQRDEKYVDKLPRKVLSLIIVFFFTVFTFLLVNIVKGIQYDLFTIVLSFFGLESIGNSNWYLVAIMVLWLCSYVAYKQHKYNKDLVLIVLMALYAAVVGCFKSSIWFDTIPAYIYGVLFAKNESWLMKWINMYSYLIIIAGGLISLCGGLLNNSFFLFEIRVVFFCLFWIAISTKVRFGNAVLFWLSKYALEIYLTQRIPMIILQELISPNIIYFSICFVFTILLAIIWKRIFQMIKGICLKEKG